jgi:hypothetical protein
MTPFCAPLVAEKGLMHYDVIHLGACYAPFYRNEARR